MRTFSLRQHGLRQEAGGFLHAEDEVHVLQRLVGRALDKVVDAGQDDGAPLTRLSMQDRMAARP